MTEGTCLVVSWDTRWTSTGAAVCRLPCLHALYSGDWDLESSRDVILRSLAPYERQ